MNLQEKSLVKVGETVGGERIVRYFSKYLLTAAGALETWTINFLQTRVATENQDNLISKFQNVVASRENDYYRVTYEVMINNEVTKIFFILQAR